MSRCLNRGMSDKLIVCRSTEKNSFSKNAMNIIKQEPKEHYCTICVVGWMHNVYEHHKQYLEMCTRFDEDYVNDKYIFKGQFKNGNTLVFFPDEMEEEQKKLIRELKVLTDKVKYVYAKGYQIPFYKQYTREHNRRIRPYTHTDKYGNKKE